MSDAKKPNKKNIEQNLQQKYLELQMIDARAKQIQKQIQKIDSQALEILKISDELDEIGSMKSKKKILVPFSAGIFMEAEMKAPEELIVSVGGNVAVKKTLAETKKIVQSQVQELENIKAQLMMEFNDSAMLSQNIERELMKLSEEINS